MIPSSGLAAQPADPPRQRRPPSTTRPWNASGVAVGTPNTLPEYLFYDVGLDHGGLELLDPSDDEGVCQGHDLGDGANIVILTYDLQLAPGVEPGDVITNTASVTQYASRNGGPSFLDSGGPLTDTADVTVANATSSKIFMLTSEAHTSDASVPPRVAIGEIVRYRLVVRLPEGMATNFQMQDLLPAGMGFLDDGTARLAFVTNGTGISSAAFGSVPAIAGACTVNGSAADGTTPAAPCHVPSATSISAVITARPPIRMPTAMASIRSSNWER